MVHELLGINLNRVEIRTTDSQGKTQQEELLLSEAHDPFYAEHWMSNFGDLGVAVKQHLENFQEKTKNYNDVKTTEELKNIVESLPQNKQLAAN
ncbi:vacuolar protein sorting-associated protein, putative [Eimeria maxima]|uniref:Vacuolar protein sorting-associated protein, putative n=1 Tax=Eimeria maxima TaxID=5804 RepID=U6M1V2_EIMMA|nr:vacuolar protein sorting-associated protein, putative [Eimeria maxima]CDJ58207.1 vacuolar protein sorting-associated protein, putative [Eimeria maxima]